MQGTVNKNGFPNELVGYAVTANGAGYYLWSPDRLDFQRTVARRAELLQKATHYNMQKLKQCFEDTADDMFASCGQRVRATPISLPQAVKSLKADRSAGECLTGMYKQKGDVPFREFTKVRENLLSGGPLPATKVVFRRHVARKRKVRTAYNVPAGIVALEAMFAIPLSEIAHDQPMSSKIFGTGYSWYSQDPIYLRNRFDKPNRVCLDAANFDMSIPPFMVRLAMSEFKKCFQLTGNQEQIFDKLVDYIVNTPIRRGSGVDWLSMGVISGSRWTHLLCCMIMASIVRYLGNNQIKDYMVYGDDVIAITEEGFSLSDLCSQSQNIHLNFSPEKSSTRFEWLGLVLSDKGFWEPVNPAKRLAKFLFPERRDPTNNASWMKARLQNHLLSAGNGRYSRFIHELIVTLGWHETVALNVGYFYVAQALKITSVKSITALHATLWRYA